MHPAGAEVFVRANRADRTNQLARPVVAFERALAADFYPTELGR